MAKKTDPQEIVVPDAPAPVAGGVEKDVVRVRFEADKKSPIPRWPFLVSGFGFGEPLEPRLVQANDGGEAISRYCMTHEPPIDEPARCQFKVSCQDPSRLETAYQRKKAVREKLGLPMPVEVRGGPDVRPGR